MRIYSHQNLQTQHQAAGSFLIFWQTSAAAADRYTGAGEDAGEGVRVAGVGGGRARPDLPVREGRRVPAHPRRLLPRAQALASVPQAPGMI